MNTTRKQNGINSPSVGFEAISPADAHRLLATNTKNRNIRRTRVNKYAEDMRSGNWKQSNDAICIGVDGALLNGQHRLLAIVESGATIDVLVMRDVPSEAMEAMDTGAGRSAGDFLGSMGMGKFHANYLAAASKLLVLIESGRIYASTFNQQVSNAQIREFIETYPDVETSVGIGTKAYRNVDCPPRVLIAAHWLISQVNGEELATHFLKQIGTPVGEPEGSAVLAVASRLREIKRNKRSYEPQHVLAMILRGWNHYAAGTSVRGLPITVPVKHGEFRIPPVDRWNRPPEQRRTLSAV